MRVVPFPEIAMFFWWPFLPALDPVDTATGQRHNAKGKARSSRSYKGGRQRSKAKTKRKAVRKSAGRKSAARKPAGKTRR